MGARLQERLAGLRAHPLVGDVRGLGLLGAVELVRDRQTRARYEPAAGVARRVSLHALADGVIVRALGGDVVALSPPFVITAEQIDHVVEVLDRAIGSVEQELAGER
jgi:4-aminobutyrate--pyruvate transaminase